MQRDNQQERLLKRIKFDQNFQWYLTGFVDGEGSFSVSLKKRPDCPFGFQIDPSFYVYQHEKNMWILILIQKFFHGGGIHRKTSPYSVYTYALHGIRNMQEKIIPFFLKHPLLAKSACFELFKDIVWRMSKGEHLTREGFVRIATLASQMNQMGKGRKWSLQDLLGESSETGS